MRKTKYMLDYFAFYDRDGIESFLQKQAAKGWLLDSLFSHVWKFRRIEPSKVHFSVVYFPKEKRSSDISSQMAEFARYCAATGWHLTESKDSRQIYYNTEPDPTPIETDFLMEGEKLRKAAVHSFLKPTIERIACMVIYILLFVSWWKVYPEYFFENQFLILYLLVFTFFLLDFTEILCYLITCIRIRFVNDTDSAFHTVAIPPAVRYIFFALIPLCIFLLGAWYYAVFLLFVIVVFMLGRYFYKLLSEKLRWYVNSKVARVLICALPIVFSIACIIGVGNIAIKIEAQLDKRNYDPVLDIESIFEQVEQEDYQIEGYTHNSILLYNDTSFDIMTGHDGYIYINYTFYNTSVDVILDCLDNHYLNKGWIELEPAPYNVEAIYQEPRNSFCTYYLIFEACRLDLTMEFEPTQDQLCKIVDAFREYAIFH